MTESEEKRPSIPHAVEQYEDCVGCHNLDGIDPFPAGKHEEHDPEKCQVCHKPRDET